MCEVFSSKCKVKLVKVHLACQSQLDRLRKTVFECVRLLIIMLKQRCNILNLAVLISQFTHSGIRLSFTCPSSDYNFLDFSIPFQALCTFKNFVSKIYISVQWLKWLSYGYISKPQYFLSQWRGIVLQNMFRHLHSIPLLDCFPKMKSNLSQKPVLLGKFESDINGKKIS